MKGVFATIKYTLLFSAIITFLASCSSSKKNTTGSTTISKPALQPEPESKTGRITNTTQYEKKIRNKYAAFIGIAPGDIQNIDLFTFIDQWLYTPYKYAGVSKDGVDCSGFVQRLLADVYHFKIIRKSSAAFYKQNTEHYNSRYPLSEGDVVFFQTGSGNDITHMGLYVGNRMFVHASSTYGVSIASLDNQYWRPRYAGAGRCLPGSSATTIR